MKRIIGGIGMNRIVKAFMTFVILCTIQTFALNVFAEEQVVGGQNRAVPTELDPGIVYIAQGDSCGLLSNPGKRDGATWYCIDTEGYDLCIFSFPIVTNDNLHWIEVLDEDGNYIDSSPSLRVNDETTYSVMINGNSRLYVQVLFVSYTYGDKTSKFSICLEAEGKEPRRDTHLWKPVDITKARLREPTCTKEGILATEECILCGTAKVESIPVIPHSPGEWTIEEEATCVLEGKAVQRCTECSTVIDEKTVPPLGHDPSTWVTISEAGCISDGLRGVQCKRCRELLDSEIIPATGHVFGEWETITEATYREPGYNMRVCSVCGAEEIIETTKDMDDGILESGDYELEIQRDDTVKLIGYYGPDGPITLPETIEGYKLSAISYTAFARTNYITRIRVPDSVVIIDGATFGRFDNMEMVVTEGSYAEKYAIDHEIQYTCG